MESTSENTPPDEQKSNDQAKETSLWDAAKLMKAFQKKRNVTHSFKPLVIVIIFCAIAGSIAIHVLPDREKISRKRWSGIYRFSDDLVGFLPYGVFDISPEFETATAITHVGQQGILVCGGKASGENCKIVHYSMSGEILGRILLPALPSDILMTNDNPVFADKILVAYRYGVWVYDLEGKQTQVFSAPVSLSPNQEPFITSIAVHEDALYMADAMQNVIYRFNAKGECDLVIGRNVSRDENDKPFPGFAPDLPYFDLTVDPDGVLWVGDTKNRRLVAFDHDGKWLSSKSWGKSGFSTESLLQGNSALPAPDEFFGNNPTSIAVLNDGRFVTVERIVNQVKVFSNTGEFLTYVTAPDYFGNETDLVFWVDKELQRQAQGDFWIPTLRVDVFPNNTVALLDQMRLKVHLFVEK